MRPQRDEFEDLDNVGQMYKIPEEELPRLKNRSEVACKDIAGKNVTELNFKEIQPSLKGYSVQKG